MSTTALERLSDYLHDHQRTLGALINDAMAETTARAIETRDAAERARRLDRAEDVLPAVRASLAAGHHEHVLEAVTTLVESVDRALTRAGNLEAEAERLRVRCARLEKDVERLQGAIRWALGESDDFPAREPGQGPYWWRVELRRRAKGD